MAQVIIDIKDMGQDPKSKGTSLVGFSVSLDVKEDPSWLSGLAKVVKQAVDALLEQTVGLKKETDK